MSAASNQSSESRSRGSSNQMDKVVFTLGRTSPVDTSSPIKAIRVGRRRDKGDGSLATVAWPASWTEEVSELLSEEEGERTLDSEAVVKRLRHKEIELEKLRELNSMLLNRIHQNDEDRQAALDTQKGSSVEGEDQGTSRLQEDNRILQDKEKQLLQDLSLQQRLHAETEKAWELQQASLMKKIELLEVQNQRISEDLDAARQRQEFESAASEHVVLMLVLAGGESQEQTPECCDEKEAVPRAESPCTTTTVDAQDIDESEGALEVIPEAGVCQSQEHVEKEGPTTPPISPEKVTKLDINAPEFTRPIPSNISWADLVEDDSRWYDESDEKPSAAAPAPAPAPAPAQSDVCLDREPAGEVNKEPSDEQEWLSNRGKGEFKAFRAFNHYRASSFDNSSKRTPKRSPRKSPSYQSQGLHNSLGKASTQPGPRHQTHRSMDRSNGQQSNDDARNPWPEWSGSSPDYGNVQKVSSGVLVVDRKVPKQNTPVHGGPRRSKSDIPQCRRHVAGYCKFEDKCWFRHD